MNHHPKRISEGYESYLQIIAGAKPNKAETVFSAICRLGTGLCFKDRDLEGRCR